MEINIKKTEKLDEFLKQKRIYLSDMGNGIMDIDTSRNSITVRYNIGIIISQLMEDNPDLIPVSLAIHSSSNGTLGAIIIFVSKKKLYHGRNLTRGLGATINLRMISSAFLVLKII